MEIDNSTAELYCTNSSQQSSSVQPFRFLDLPVEIWTSIAMLLCTKDVEEEYCRLDPHEPTKQLAQSLQQPPITRTCKLIRDEILPYFYSQTYFGFKDNGNDLLKGLDTWIRAIGPDNYSRIDRVYVSSSGELDRFLKGLHVRRGFPLVVREVEKIDKCLTCVYRGHHRKIPRIYRLGLPEPDGENDHE